MSIVVASTTARQCRYTNATYILTFETVFFLTAGPASAGTGRGTSVPGFSAVPDDNSDYSADDDHNDDHNTDDGDGGGWESIFMLHG